MQTLNIIKRPTALLAAGIATTVGLIVFATTMASASPALVVQVCQPADPDPDCDYYSIQSALDGIDGQTTNNKVRTIEVKVGEYTEDLDVNVSNVVLKGLNGTPTVKTAGSNVGVDITNQEKIAFENIDFVVDGENATNLQWHLKVYRSKRVEFKDSDFTGPGKAFSKEIGGLDFNSTKHVKLTDVVATEYSKNGFAVTALYEQEDTDYRSSYYDFKSVTFDNNGWNGMAFYTHSNTHNVKNDIGEVTFAGTNSLQGNGHTGLLLQGDSDEKLLGQEISNHNTKPTERIRQSYSSPLTLGNTAFGGNGIANIVNYQQKDVDAKGASGLTPDSIYDEAENPKLGKVITETVAPSVPTGLNTTNGGTEPNGVFDLFWDASTDASPPVTYQYQSTQNPALNPDGSFVAPVFGPVTLTSPTIHSSGTPVGTWYYQVRAIDVWGNQSDWSAPGTVVVLP